MTVRESPIVTRNRLKHRLKLGHSWSWRFDHDWRIWIDRTPYECGGGYVFKWRFNIGPLHIVRFL